MQALDEVVDQMFRRLTAGGAAVEVTSGAPSFPSKAGLHERRRFNVKGGNGGEGAQDESAEALHFQTSPTNHSDPERTSTVNQSMVNLLNAVLGTGVLGLPYCFKTCGVLLATVTILVCLAVCNFSLQALLYSSAVTAKYSYEDVAHATLGLNARRVVRISTIALLLGCVVAYINIISDIFSSVAGTIVPPGAEPSRQQVMILVVVMGFFPLTLLIRSAKSIASTSGFGLAMVWMSSHYPLFFFSSFSLLTLHPALWVPFCQKVCSFSNQGGPYETIIAFATAVVWISQHRDEYYRVPSADKPMLMWNTEGLPLILPVISFSFSAHPVVFPVLQTLQHPSPTRVVAVINRALMLSCAIYLVIGVSGYVTFRAAGYVGFIMRFLKLGYGASIATCIPLVFITLREALMPSFLVFLRGGFKAQSNPNTSDVFEAMGRNADSEREGRSVEMATAVHDAALNVMLLGVALLAAVAVPNVEFVFGLVGATACSLLIFILPALIFLATVTSSSSKTLPMLVSYPGITNDLSVSRASDSRVAIDANSDANASTHGGILLEPISVTEFGWITGCGAAGSRLIMRLVCVMGIIIAVICTRTTILAVREEAEVVQLVQDLWTAEKKAASAAKQYEKVYQAADKLSKVEAASQAVSVAKEHTSATLQVVRTAAAALDGLTEEASSSKGEAKHERRDRGMAREGTLAGMGTIVDKVFNTNNQGNKNEDNFKAMEAAAAEVAAVAKSYSGETVMALKDARDALARSFSPPPSGQADTPPMHMVMDSDSTTTIDDASVVNPEPPALSLLQPPPSPTELSYSGAAIAEDKAAVARAAASNKVTLEISAELNETMAKATTTARALDKLKDITSEVIGAMATSKKHKWEVSSAVARARNRLYDVKSVLNTTAETDSVLTMTLNKLKEEKEIQAAEVLRAAMDAASKAGAEGHDVNELLSLLESIEADSKSFPGFEDAEKSDPTLPFSKTQEDSARTETIFQQPMDGQSYSNVDEALKEKRINRADVSADATETTKETALSSSALLPATGTTSDQTESISDKVASMAKRAAEKAVETEVKAVMAKAEAKSDAVVERAAEIARQLALGDLISQESHDAQSEDHGIVSTAADGLRGLETQNVTVGVSDIAGVDDVVTVKEVHSNQSSAYRDDLELTAPVSNDKEVAHVAVSSQRPYVPLLDSNFYRAKESDLASKESPQVADEPPSKMSMNWGSEMQKYMTKVTSKLHPKLRSEADDEGDVLWTDDLGMRERNANAEAGDE